jgi:DNA-binding transcriptional ArsR family regulator
MGDEGSEPAPDRDVRVLEALSDDVARTALRMGLERPVTARDIADVADVSRSTVYSRLDELSELSLMVETTAVDRPSAGSYFETESDEFSVALTESGVEVRPVDDRLASCIDLLFETFEIERVTFDRTAGMVSVEATTDSRILETAAECYQQCQAADEDETG